MKYIPTIGLEVHMEVKTNSKMFCRCPNIALSISPNENVCPVCLGHPGAMPVVNKEAIKSILRLGAALKAEISKTSRFDRKSYFYPDLPKGYQISQYEYPFIKNGELIGIKIRRIHLEEDTGKLLHSESGETLCDYNRAGVPLIELVTEPTITSGEEAVRFTKELQLALRYLNISSADMEKGEMRLEANISLRHKDSDKLGTKVEVKNLNSFSFMAKAIDYEIKRQIEILEKGESVLQETRGWDRKNNKTFSQRIKEDAHDYRYLPEPDLSSFDLTDKSFINLDEVYASIPEMPWQKRDRFVKEFGISESSAFLLAEEKSFAGYFEDTISEIMTESVDDEEKKKAIQVTTNYMIADVKGIINQLGEDIVIFRDRVNPENMADLVMLIVTNKITSRMAKDILFEMHQTKLDPRNIIENKNITQVSDEGIISKIAMEVIDLNPKIIDDYKKGKTNVTQFIFGQTMAKLQGRGDPETIKLVINKCFQDRMEKSN